MQKIGEGYWYQVFQISEHRVLKLEKSFIQKLKYTYYRVKSSPLTWLQTISSFVFTRRKMIADYDFLKSTVDLKILANPSFTDSLNYEQNLVEPISIIFDSATLPEQKKLVDKYIDNVLTCWEYGFSDTVFNFTLNNGVDSAGNVVLLDFNEITRDKNVVKQKIAIKRWKFAYSIMRLDEEIKHYILEQMEKRITIKNLNQLWQIKM